MSKKVKSVLKQKDLEKNHYTNDEVINIIYINN